MAYGESLARLNPCSPQRIKLLLDPLLSRGEYLIDIGCGRGATLAWFAQHSTFVLYGAEPDAALYALARQNCPEANLTHAKADKLPFEDAAFDIAIMECVFSLLENPKAAAAEASRILRRGAVFLLSDLYALSGENLFFEQSSLLRNVYAKTRIEDYITESGFLPYSFTDCTQDMRSMAAQMILDGALDTDSGLADKESLKQLRRAKAGYGIWIFLRR